jgi:membrane associated rhomboid family serine protease
MPSAPEPTRSDDDPPPELIDGDRRWGTVGLLFVNLAVGLLMAWAGVPLVVPDDASGLIAFGAVDPPRVWSGEVWRLLTACFVHVGAVHLGLNLWVLWQVGRAYERLVGPARVVLVYVVSGIFGFALSTALSPGLTAGASGALFGLTGALLAVAALTRQQQLGRFLLSALLPFVLATFALGVLAPGFINNVAHGGGLVMGFVLGYGLCAGEEAFLTADDAVAQARGVAPSSWSHRLGGVALVLAVATFAAVTLYSLKPRYSPRFHAVMGVRAAHDASVARTDAAGAEALGRAREHLRRARVLAPDDATTRALAARVAAVEGDEATARAQMATALATWLATHGDRKAALEAAHTELALLQPHDEMPWADGFTARALCDAALDDDGRRAAGPELKNGCAWLLLRAREPVVRDPARALPLAQEAWIDSNKERPEITHTYADALAQNGAAREGLALLELLAVSGKAGALDARFLDAERARLARLADEQERGRATQADAPADAAPDAGTPAGAATDAGTPDAGTPADDTPDAGTPANDTPDAGATDGGVRVRAVKQSE